MNKKHIYKKAAVALFVLCCIVLGACKVAGTDTKEESFGEETVSTQFFGAVNGDSLTATEVIRQQDPDVRENEMSAEGEPAENKSAYNASDEGIHPDTASNPDDDAEIFVHVCGAVNEPGVYRLKAGSRIFEAVEAAGGLSDKADGSVINQADFCTDGMQIFVPEEFAPSDDGEQSSFAGTGYAGNDVFIKSAENSPQKADDTASSSDKVNINTADMQELTSLSGIGQSRAEAIIAYRNEKGGFSSTEEIMNISGIKEGLYGKIKDKITVE